MKEELNKTPRLVQKEIIIQLKSQIEQIIVEQKNITVKLVTIRKGIEHLADSHKDLEKLFTSQIQINHTIHADNNKMISTLLKIVDTNSKSKANIQVKALELKEKVLLGLFGTGGLAGIIAAIVGILNR